MIERVILIILDSVGAGSMPDAAAFNDEGANTLGHINDIAHPVLRNLCSLGLGRVVKIDCSGGDIKGAYGLMNEMSPGKDTTTGHWEIACLPTKKAFPTYPKVFLKSIIKSFEESIGRKTLGNIPSSGTTIINELGPEHINTGYPIVYTSADSVFQIAAHEEKVPLEELYYFCSIARGILIGKHAVARVIARPFGGLEPDFIRNNAGRKDFSLQPPSETLLDRMEEHGMFTAGIGKIGDLFGHRGLTEEKKTKDNKDGVSATIDAMKRYRGRKGLIFTNLVDFDMVYGHRRNIEGYARALEEFDEKLTEIMDAMDDSEILILTADHGCDPSYSRHTDHTREYVPILIYGSGVKSGVDIGIRGSFSDCGRTIADILEVPGINNGVSFKEEIING